MKKNKIDYKVCPKCKSETMVMGGKAGYINFYGCTKCKNAQGLHSSAKDAKAAWKKYCESYEAVE